MIGRSNLLRIINADPEVTMAAKVLAGHMAGEQFNGDKGCYCYVAEDTARMVAMSVKTVRAAQAQLAAKGYFSVTRSRGGRPNRAGYRTVSRYTCNWRMGIEETELVKDIMQHRKVSRAGDFKVVVDNSEAEKPTTELPDFDRKPTTQTTDFDRKPTTQTTHRRKEESEEKKLRGSSAFAGANAAAVQGEDDLFGGLPEVDQERLAVNAWNDMAQDTGLVRVQKLTNQRRPHLRARLKDGGGIEGWRLAVHKVSEIGGLCGHGKTGWKASFDWLLKEQAFTKLMEGAYDDWKSKEQLCVEGRERLLSGLYAGLKRNDEMEECDD